MSNLIHDLEENLLNKQRQIELQLQFLENNDPVLQGMGDMPAEIGTAAWQAEVHAKSVVIRSNLQNLSSKISMSLAKLKKGSYGSCEKCGKQIEEERLRIIPTATACAICISFVSQL